MLMPVIGEALASGRHDQRRHRLHLLGLAPTTSPAPRSASCMTLDGVGPWPPIQETHVEMDGAWALYEAWVKLQLGEIDTALVYGYGKSSPGDLREVLTRQLDPYYRRPAVARLGVASPRCRPGPLLDAGKATESRLAEVAARSRKAALDNPLRPAGVGHGRPTTLLAEPTTRRPAAQGRLPADHRRRRRRGPRRRRRGPRSCCERPGWIRGIDHRIEPHGLGLRDLTDSPSTRAGRRARPASADGTVDVAELHAPFTHQELILRDGARPRRRRRRQPVGRRAAPPTR